MALEQITTEMDIQKPAKTKDKQGPKKPLGSMKKKYVKGVEVMDTELRSNVPVKQVQKEDQDFVNAMEDARIKTAKEIAAKDKPKIKVMKKLGKAAKKDVEKTMGEEIKKSSLKAAADLAPMIPPEPFKPHESLKPHIMEEINLDLPKKAERPKYESVREAQNSFMKEREEQDKGMKENFSRLQKDLAENRDKLKSLKKNPVKKKD